MLHATLDRRRSDKLKTLEYPNRFSGRCFEPQGGFGQLSPACSDVRYPRRGAVIGPDPGAAFSITLAGSAVPPKRAEVAALTGKSWRRIRR